jgi:hypothetical protein
MSTDNVKWTEAKVVIGRVELTFAESISLRLVALDVARLHCDERLRNNYAHHLTRIAGLIQSSGESPDAVVSEL